MAIVALKAFVTDTRRAHRHEVALALDDKGKFWREGAIQQIGAPMSQPPASASTPTTCALPAGHVPDPESRCLGRLLFLNTILIGPYRGAGRPEANYALSAVEEAALHHRHRSRALRKKISFRPRRCRQDADQHHDSGDFPGIVDKALKLADFDNFNKRKRESAKRKKFRGIGVSCMLEHAGALPMEQASVAFPGDDKLILGCNVQSTGQGHATVFGRLLANHLGIDAKKIEHRHGDTNQGLTGFASVGSRSAMCAGNAIIHVADVMLAKGKKVASAALEASESDIQYRNGSFEVVGTDRKISLFETAKRAKEFGENLDTKDKLETPLTFPNGCHIAEVEVDPDTGAFDIVTYTAVDDAAIFSANMVEGQVA